MNLDFANAIFAWVATGTTSLISIVVLINDHLLKTKTDLGSMSLPGKIAVLTGALGSFSLWTFLKLVPELDTEHCLNGYNGLDFANWCLIMLSVLIPFLSVGCVCMTLGVHLILYLV